MASWSLFFGVVALLLSNTDSKAAIQSTSRHVSHTIDPDEVLQKAIQYIARDKEELELSEDANHTTGESPVLKEYGDDGAASPDDAMDDDDVDSGDDKSKEKRRWGDSSMQMWGKRRSEIELCPGLSSDKIRNKESVDKSLDKNRQILCDPDVLALPQQIIEMCKERRKREIEAGAIAGKASEDFANFRKCLNDIQTKLEKQEDRRKRHWGDNSLTVWGKRMADYKRKWGDNSMSVWGKRQAEGKRKWGDNSMTVWGKRAAQDKRKWGDNAMSVWGKRQDEGKRRWGDNSVTAWGKRLDQDQEQVQKRKWGDNSMTIWGKKRTDRESQEQDRGRWSSKLSDYKINPVLPVYENQVMRGDRTQDFDRERGATERHDGGHVTTGATLFMHSSKDQGERGGVSSMTYDSTADAKSNRKTVSKRSVVRNPDTVNMFPSPLLKRGWGFWGTYVTPYGGPKRNWETNTMKVWGKRRHEFDEPADEYDDVTSGQNDGFLKRLWSSDNSLRIWGK